MKKNLSMFLFLVLVNSALILCLEKSTTFKSGLGFSVDTLRINKLESNPRQVNTTKAGSRQDNTKLVESSLANNSTFVESIKDSTNTTTETSSKVGKNNKSLRKQAADKVDPNIDGLGTSTLNPSNGAKPLPNAAPLIVTAAPFKVTECNQMLMFDAEYIEDLRDYRKRVPGFFTINVLSAHVFKNKDANNLIHSVNFPTLKTEVAPLKGARGCISMEGGVAVADLTICFKSEGEANNLLTAIKQFAKCRQGENLLVVSDEELKALNKLCSGDKKEESGPNKWTNDRLRHFHPDATSHMRVPGEKEAPAPAPVNQ